MELKHRKIKIHWWHILLFIIFIFLATDQILTNYLNDKFSENIHYSYVDGFSSENYNDCRIMAGKAHFLSWTPIRVIVAKDNVCFNESHKTVSITLTIYVSKFGKKVYMLGFDDWDETKNRYDYSFGGYAYVDSNMKILDAKENDGINRKRIEEYLSVLNDSIKNMVDIANYYWDLGLAVEP